MGAVVQCGTVLLSRPIPAAAAMEGVIFIHVGMTAAVTVGLVTISAGMNAAKVVAVTTNAEMIEAMEAAVADINLIRSVFIMRKFKLFFHFHLVDCIHKCEINANLTLKLTFICPNAELTLSSNSRVMFDSFLF